MSEIENTEEVSSVVEEESSYSELQKVAIEAGWDPKGKKDEKSFLLDGLKMRNEKITDLYHMHEDMKTMMKQQEKNLYEQAKKDLAAQRDEAIQRGDVQEVHKLDKDEAQLKMQIEIQSAANKFVQDNESWYKGVSSQEIKMQRACSEADRLIAAKQLPPEQHFKALEQYMKDEFPDYFGQGEAKTKTVAVEGGQGQAISRTKKKFSYDDLSNDQKNACDRYVKMKVMTRDEYVDEIVKAGRLK